MAINFVAAGAAEADSISFAAHQENDIILIMAYRNTTTNISFPAGWDELSINLTTVSRRSVIATKRAASSSETSGTWTNASHLMYYIARPTDTHLIVGNVKSSSTNNSTTQNNPNLNCRKSSRAVRMVAFDPSSATGYAEQTDFTSRQASVFSDAACHVSDSDSMVASVALYTNTMSEAIRCHSWIFEILETSFDLAGGGGGGVAFPVIGGGGLVY